MRPHLPKSNDSLVVERCDPVVKRDFPGVKRLPTLVDVWRTDGRKGMHPVGMPS